MTLSGSARLFARLATPSAQPDKLASAAGADFRVRLSSQTRQPMLSQRSALTLTVQPAFEAASTCRPAPDGCHSLSFRSTVSFSVIAFSDRFARVFRAVEGQEC